MKVLFLFGPNLGALGTGDPERYGRQTLAEIMGDVASRGTALGHEVEWRQSDHEGELVGWLVSAAGGGFGGGGVNPRGLPPSSYAARGGPGCSPPRAGSRSRGRAPAATIWRSRRSRGSRLETWATGRAPRRARGRRARRHAVGERPVPLG